MKNFKNFITAFFMGANSGLSYALLGSTLTAYLADMQLNLILLGFLSLRTMPFSLKFLWAPFLDNHRISCLPKDIGLRKGWMLCMQVLLIILICSLGFIDIKKHFVFFCVITVLIAFFAATYDIAIDAYRIEIFRKSDALKGNTCSAMGFRVGLLVSAALALYLSAFISWQLVFIMLGLSMIPVLIIIYNAEEINPSKEYFKIKEVKFENYFKKPFLNLLKLPKAYIVFMLIIFYKLSDSCVDIMLIPFLEDIGFSKEDIAVSSKPIGVFAGMVGTFAGNFILSRFSVGASLFLAEAFAALSNITFLTLIVFSKSNILLACISFLESFCSGVCNLALVTYMSSLCSKKFTATHFALLMSISSFGRVMLSSTSGLIATYFDWSTFFIFSSALSIPSLICIYILFFKKKNNKKSFR